MSFTTIEWIGELEGCVRILDQTRLPGEVVYVDCRTPEEVFAAVRRLQVRGAPAIGIAAAMGLVLGIRDYPGRDSEGFLARAHAVAERLNSARPTAVNLGWALRRMLAVAEANGALPVDGLQARLLAEAHSIRTEDALMCRAIGANGAALLRDGDGVLTHCNAGGLATAEYGTALAVIRAAHERGLRLRVYADETRPLLQGARLTAWELMQSGIDVTLICDNMAGWVMRLGRVQRVVVGADRIAANGDTANKVGTYSVALLAREHGIPFYVAAPSSTFDLALASGEGIPIEERAAEEITQGFGRRTAPEGVKVFNPAFDVTPARWITAIITERGVIHRPDTESVRAHFR
jgi:methylthioribose-1-phosphate isomerase